MKKKILLIGDNSDPTKGGWAKIGRTIYDSVNSNQIDITFVAKSGSEKKPNFVYTISKDSYLRPFSLKRDLETTYKILKNKKYDLIICNVEPYLPLAVGLKKKLNIKKLLLIGHGTYVYYPFVNYPFRFFNMKYRKYIDHMIVPSNFTKSKVREWFEGKISLVNWGVDLKQYHSVNVKKEKCFIHVGQQKERKGSDLLLYAFKEVIKKHPEYKLYLIGSKAHRFEKLSEKLGLKDNVVFTGRISDKEKLEFYSKARAHVLPSINQKKNKYGLIFYYFEGYGVVHLEANACGIPTIGSKNTANEDTIVNKKTGFLCKQGDYKDIAKKMILLIEDNKLYNKMCKEALLYAKKNSWEKGIAEIKEVIDKCLKL